jgi:hypothetical protein
MQGESRGCGEARDVERARAKRKHIHTCWGVAGDKEKREGVMW